MSSRRLLNSGKPEHKLSARKNSDINKFKIKPQRVPEFGGRVPNKTKQVVNNASIHPRMLPSQVARIKFRQEIDHKTGIRQLPRRSLGVAGPEFKKPPPLKKLDSERFVRVANNLFRNEESVLDQADRVTFSINTKREISKRLNGVKVGQDRLISNILTAGHLAEKQADAENDKQFMSEFTGPTKTLVEVPQMKQQLDDNMNIQKRARPSQKNLEFQGTVKKFADKLGIDFKL